MSTKGARRRRRGWRWVFDGRDLAGIVEEQADGSWRVIVAGQNVGVVGTRQAAEALVRKIAGADRRSGADGR